MSRSKKQLTVKQAKLVKGIAEGKPKQVAALEAGYGSSLESAAAIAQETLRNPHVQNALQVALEKAGVTPELAVAPIAEALRHDDLDYRLKGSDRATKIMQPNNDAPIAPNVVNIINEQKNIYDI